MDNIETMVGEIVDKVAEVIEGVFDGSDINESFRFTTMDESLSLYSKGGVIDVNIEDDGTEVFGAYKSRNGASLTMSPEAADDIASHLEKLDEMLDIIMRGEYVRD